MRQFIYTLILAISIVNAKAQQKEGDRVPGSLLVMFRSEAAAAQLLSKRAATISQTQRLSAQPSIYRIDCEVGSENELLRAFQRETGVEMVQHNHYAALRKTPNDTKFEQWQWAADSLGLVQAWDYSTGGVNGVGDTIVVAIIDGGIDVAHEDLASNLWHNRAEIANNGIDDDLNGWVDDYNGWNFSTQNDSHANNSHGCSVAGIVGAVGNNFVGIAGVNWQVKLMILSGEEEDMVVESNIVAAYGYALQARRLYNQSNGQQGAYVVSTNASLGVNYGEPEDYPIWCAMYDSLGKEGIISAGATANAALNVDAAGDIPTACPSNFLIAVTQSTRENELHGFSAYGKTSIDLAAPGAVYTTRPDNAYNTFGGTSGASPHVAGAVALLFAHPNKRWAQQQKEQPEQSGLWVKQLLLDNVRRFEDFDNKTVSGGILHVGSAMKRLDEYFMEPDETTLVNIFPNPTNHQLTLQCAVAEAGDFELEIVDMMGRRCWRCQFSTDRAQMFYHSIWVADWAKGVYAARLCQGKKCWTVKWAKG